jgi:hypothetical protein
VDGLPGVEPAEENLEHHYRLTWTGFDLIEVLAIYLTAYWAFRLDARVVYPATVVATVLVADAWFDVTTSATAADATQALILALLVELPAAAFSLYAAHRVGRRVRKLAYPGHVLKGKSPLPPGTGRVCRCARQGKAGCSGALPDAPAPDQ